MARHLSLIFFSCYVFFSGLLSSCNNGPVKIIYMEFLDGSGETYYSMDTLHKEPFKTMTLYFLVDKKSEINEKDYKQIEKFVSSDSLVQSQINKKYFELTASFYKSSDNTDRLLRFKSKKELVLCGNDLSVEYQWSNGKGYDTTYYEDGQMRGAEKIQLHDIDP